MATFLVCEHGVPFDGCEICESQIIHIHIPEGEAWSTIIRCPQCKRRVPVKDDIIFPHGNFWFTGEGEIHIHNACEMSGRVQP